VRHPKKTFQQYLPNADVSVYFENLDIREGAATCPASGFRVDFLLHVSRVSDPYAIDAK